MTLSRSGMSLPLRVLSPTVILLSVSELYFIVLADVVLLVAYLGRECTTRLTRRSDGDGDPACGLQSQSV